MSGYLVQIHMTAASNRGLHCLPLIRQFLGTTTCSEIPINLQRGDNVVTTSLQRHDVAATL